MRPRGRGLRVAFSRALRRKVTVDVLRHSRGAHVLGTVRRVKRFAARTRSFTWDGRGLAARAPGYFTVRVRMRLPGGGVDERRVVLERRRGGRFARRPASVRRSSCRLFTRFVLRSPVFGATRKRRQTIHFALAHTVRARVDVLRGRRVVRTLQRMRRLPAGRARGLSLAARSLPRGRYRIRLTIRRAGAPARSVTLVTRRL